MSASVVWAQEATPAETPSEPPSPSAPSTPIPFSEVVTQAENAVSTLKKIASGAASDPRTDAIEQDLPALIDEINSRLEETARTIEASTSLDSLRSFEADWRTLTRSLPGWRDDLNARAKTLEDDLRQLNELADRWRKTLAELNRPETPPEVLDRISEVIRIASETRRSLTEQQSRVIALQNRLAEQQTRVDEAYKAISARRDALVGQLLVRDSPSIWSSQLWSDSNIRNGLADSLRIQFDGLSAFGQRNKDKLIVHLLLFAALAGLLFYLRRRARPLIEADQELKQASAIFYLPVSTALVLAIIFTSRIYPQTPQILGAIFGAIALIPTVIILRRMVSSSLYPLLYSLVVFFFIDQLRAITDAMPVISRPLFMVEMAAAIAFSWWFYRSGSARIEEEDGTRGGKVFEGLRIAALVALPFFAVALLANAIGFVGLSRLVGGAVLRSAYVAIVLYAAVRIIEGLLIFALRLRPLNLLKMARESAPQIQEKAKRFLKWAAIAIWVVTTLELFTLREAVFRELRAILTAELTIGSISISAADFLLFGIVVWAAILLSRVVRFALEEDVYPRFPLANGIPYAISTIVNYLIILGGFFLAVGAAGIDLTRVTVLVGAFGVGIGFGLQNIFNNFVSGLILLFERPVKVGDEIEIGSESGTVRRIGIRASRIRRWDQSEVIVPNSKLISENVKNWSFYARKRGIEIPVTVAHGTDTDLVKQLLIDAATEHPLVAEKPAPQVILKEIVSPTLRFRLRVWTSKSDQTSAIATDIAAAISRKFSENNIEVPLIS